jgi:hypothetical protein
LAGRKCKREKTGQKGLSYSRQRATSSADLESISIAIVAPYKINAMQAGRWRGQSIFYTIP